MVPRVVMEADTLGVFKKLLDRHMDIQEMEEHGSQAGFMFSTDIEAEGPVPTLYSCMFLA